MLSLLKKITTWTLSSLGWDGRTPQEALNQISAVTRVIMEWPEGERFSANEALQRFPHLQNSRESLISLVVQEFADRRSRGDFIDVDEFLLGFPDELRSDLNDAISVDRGLTVLSGLVTGLHAKTEGALSRIPRKLDWPESGEVFAGFLLEEPLGRGGFSRVFAARELAFEERRVAVKICRIDTHEPSVLASLQHAGIGTIHSVTEVPERGLIAICMPLLSRTTLLDVRSHVWSRTRRPTTAIPVWECVKRGNKLNRAMPLWAEASYCEWALDLTISLARSLSVSHEKGIVHCDIKPSNILLGEDGRPILFDFNIAFRELASNSPANVGGTVPYMAPEQIRAFVGEDAERVSPRSDLFALGATIYEMLTGVAPYGGVQSSQEGIERLLALRKVLPTRIRQLNPGVPSEFAEAIHSCLAYSSENRPGSADEFAGRLEQLKKRIYRPVSSRRRLAAAFAGTVAALAVAAGMFVCQAPGDGGARPETLSAAAVGTRSEKENVSPPTLSAKQIEELIGRAYALLDGDAPSEAADRFLRILDVDATHVGASIGLMRSALRMPEAPDNPLVRQIPDVFDPHSIPELEALSGTVQSGILSRDYVRAEACLRAAVRAGRTDTATLNNLAYCLVVRGQFEKAHAILKEIVSDGDVPDTARLLMVHVRIGELLSHTTKKTLDPASLSDLIAEQKFEHLMRQCRPSPLRSFTQAQIEHACCVAYHHLAASGLSAEQDSAWLQRSRAVVSAYDEAVEQGISPHCWRIVSQKLHAGVVDTDRYRKLAGRFLVPGRDWALGEQHRRAFLLDPVVGTQYERWTSASAGLIPEVPSDLTGKDIEESETATVATLQ